MATPTQTQSAADLASSYDHDDIAAEDFTEVEAKPKAKPTEEEAAVPEKPKDKNGRFRSGALARLAKRFKIADEDYASMSDEEVENAIDQFQRDRDDREVNEHVQRPVATAPSVAEIPQQPVNELFDWGRDEETGQAFTEDDGPGPATRNVLKSILKRLKAVEDKTEFVAKAEVGRQQETVHQKLDRLFDDLNSPNLFGDGHGADYDATSPERLRRDAILSAVAKAGIKSVSYKDFAKEFKKAAAILYPQAKPTNDTNGHTKAPANGATNGNGKPTRKLSSFRQADDDDEDPDYEELLRERKRQWSEGQVSRPNAGPAAEEPRGRTRAEKNLKRNMAEMGMADEDGRLADGLPD